MFLDYIITCGDQVARWVVSASESLVRNAVECVNCVSYGQRASIVSCERVDLLRRQLHNQRCQVNKQLYDIVCSVYCSRETGLRLF